jgi:hypothetical protein
VSRLADWLLFRVVGLGVSDVEDAGVRRFATVAALEPGTGASWLCMGVGPAVALALVAVSRDRVSAAIATPARSI